jgi:hypothetical protein
MCPHVLSRHTITKFYENPFSHSPHSTSGQIDITELKDWHSYATVLRKGAKTKRNIHAAFDTSLRRS